MAVTISYVDIHGWIFSYDEVSENIFRVEGKHIYGRTVCRFGIGLETPLDACKRDAQMQTENGDMPKGPKGVRRPADTNSAAVMVGRIATGEVEDKPSAAPGRAAGGKAGGKARAKALPAGKRSEIAKKGAKARWGR